MHKETPRIQNWKQKRYSFAGFMLIIETGIYSGKHSTNYSLLVDKTGQRLIKAAIFILGVLTGMIIK